MSKESIHVRASDELKEALQQAAEEDKRTLSNLVIKILEEWLEARGIPKLGVK